MSTFARVWAVGRKPKGLRSRTRKKLRKHIRERGVPRPSRVIQEFPPNSRVIVDIDPSVPKGQPHPRYHGKIGVVVERRGRAYVLQIRNGGMTKKVISRPEHLKVV
ncbi:MAG: 50S ribosomal protein L21e [Hadesarchaea archaeon]|nr:50S ribosomal protein L21e [Hadesarchaea archaeon]